MKQRLIKWRDADGETFSTAIAGDFCPREENSDVVAERAAELRLTNQVRITVANPSVPHSPPR